MIFDRVSPLAAFNIVLTGSSAWYWQLNTLKESFELVLGSGTARKEELGNKSNQNSEKQSLLYVFDSWELAML